MIRSPPLSFKLVLSATEFESGCMLRGGIVPGWVWLLLFVASYVVLTQWLLPKLGVPT